MKKVLRLGVLLGPVASPDGAGASRVPLRDGRGGLSRLRFVPERPVRAPPGEPRPAAPHPRLARGRLRAQGGTPRHRTDRGREDRRDGVAAPTRTPVVASTRRPPPRPSPPLRTRRPRTQRYRRAVPRRPPAPVGGTDPPRLRRRPPRLSSLRKRGARDRLHYTARSRPSLWPPPLEIRPARRSQAARKGGRVGPSSVPKPSRGLGRSLHPGARR
jgi:hypothetical protein